MYPVIISIVIVGLGYLWEQFQPSNATDEFYGKLFLIVIIVEFIFPLMMNVDYHDKDKVAKEPLDDTVYAADVDVEI